MRTWTEGQRRRYNIQMKLMEAGPEVRSVLKGLLASPPARNGLDVEAHVLQPIMKGDWAAFEAAWNGFAGIVPMQRGRWRTGLMSTSK